MVVVSIQCLVYNHEPFLRQCLDGFVIQKTDFQFEAIVHDDASTDGSADIIREYAERFPDIIKPIYQTENQYSKGVSPTAIVTKSCRGKYIALCEGDDYWTDPLKLQKQVDYLDAHPECAMCFGNAIEHWLDNRCPDKLFSNITDRDYDPDETSNGWLISTGTVMFRKEVYDTNLFQRYKADKRIITGDLPLWLTCATIGTLHGMSDVFSVYRRLPSGFMLSMKAEHRIAMGDHRVEIYKVFGKHYKNTTIQMAMVHYRLAMSYALAERNPKAWLKALWKSITTRLLYPDIAIKHVFQILRERKERLAAAR